MEFIEVTKAVKNLNDKIDCFFDEFDDESYLYRLQIQTDTYSFNVDFLGITIWSSENDEREYNCGECIDGEYQQLEELESFLQKQISIVISNISKIKF